MKHLFNISVYHHPDDFGRAVSAVASEGSLVDGLELLTGYDRIDPKFSKYVTSVHLPYSTDWYGPATGIRPICDGISEMDVRYYHYGANREAIVDTIRSAIEYAQDVDPMYGVLHAGSGNINELFVNTYSDSDEKVLSMFIRILNDVVKGFPDKEPPFTLTLENTWWPGMKLLDGSLHDMLESELEFDDWGICIDTGHILFSSKRSTDEDTAIRILNDCADTYPDEFFDRLIAMHLHVNTSAHLIDATADVDGNKLSFKDRVMRTYSRLALIDQHRPFTNPEIRDYVERLSPEFIVHELSAPTIPEHIRDHICQASLFS